MKTIQIPSFGVSSMAVVAALLCAPLTALGGPILGSAESFALLGHESVSNGHSAPNPTTTIFGNLGVTPGTSVTGFYPDGTVSGGSIHINDGVAQTALTDAMAAYNTLAGLPSTSNYTGFVLGSAGHSVLSPGVYTFNSSAQLTGALTLDFGATPDAIFVFQIGSALTTASGSSVTVINGGPLSGVYWQIVSSATLGSGTVFEGNILALASVTLDPTAQILCGRAVALTGAVSMTDNSVSNSSTAVGFSNGCADFGSVGFDSGGTGTGTGGGPGGGPGGGSSIPEPGTFALLSIGLVAAPLLLRKFRSLR